MKDRDGLIGFFWSSTVISRLLLVDRFMWAWNVFSTWIELRGNGLNRYAHVYHA